ncbi:hypothetical protein TNCV_154701 [Trichonephila clavipes]|uniref:Uncharacterized protein n=1 Tax=Trichonephila clavipes TaxID=2585209 RepID=A0A8X6WGY5_TRICX|nr:hypothetical protein TNCV_154701 [Trichonephila clavipes]
MVKLARTGLGASRVWPRSQPDEPDCSTTAALVNFQDNSDAYPHSVEVLSQKKICGFVPKIVDLYTLQELTEKNITLI